MTDKRTNIVVGLFVILALAILLVGVYFLKEAVPGRRTHTYHALFDQVSTLQPGDPVKVNGVKMGKVAGIELHGHRVLVSLRLEGGVDIPRNSDVRIQNIGLMGERQVGIQLGDSREAAGPGDTLSGTLDAGIAEAMGIAGEVFVEAEALVNSLRSVVDSTVGRPEFAASFNDLIFQTRRLSGELDSFMVDVKPRVKRSLDNMESASGQVRRLIREHDEPLRRIMENGEAVSAKLKEVADRGDVIAAELETLLRTINSDRSSLGAMARDSSLYIELRATLNSADSLLDQVRKRGLDVNLKLF